MLQSNVHPEYFCIHLGINKNTLWRSLNLISKGMVYHGLLCVCVCASPRVCYMSSRVRGGARHDPARLFTCKGHAPLPLYWRKVMENTSIRLLWKAFESGFIAGPTFPPAWSPTHYPCIVSKHACLWVFSFFPEIIMYITVYFSCSWIMIDKSTKLHVSC